MRDWHRLVALFLFVVILPAQAELVVEDDLGRPVRLAQPAQRIVSLAPHLTELLYSVGAGERLIGTVTYSDYPAAATKIPRVGGYNALDLERILALQPDLVVGWASGNKQADLDKLRRFGLPLFLSEPRLLEDIPETLRRLAVLTDSRGRADEAIATFEETLARLRRYSGREPVRVFYQIWDRPLMSVNDEHLIGDVIRLCGGRNIFADASALTPQVSTEAVIERAPQVIIVGGLQPVHRQWLQQWQRWPRIPAVRDERLYTINPDHLQRHTLRILQGAETLCRHLQAARDTQAQ